MVRDTFNEEKEKMVTRAVLAAAIAALCVGTAHASFSDGFSSYTNTASMLAPGAWGDDYVGAVPATLSLGFGNPAASMWHPGGRAAKHVIVPLYPSDAEPIIWEGDIWDDANPNKRLTMGLRDNGGGATLTAILEMGRYNTLVDPPPVCNMTATASEHRSSVAIPTSG